MSKWEDTKLSHRSGYFESKADKRSIARRKMKIQCKIQRDCNYSYGKKWHQSTPHMISTDDSKRKVLMRGHIIRLLPIS